MHDVCGSGCEQHLFISVRGVAFARSDKARAEVGQIGAEQLCGQNLMAMVQASCKQHGFVEKLPDFGD
ncbi:hypothetical protein D3C76_1518170 [compost metagenome]